MTIDNHPSMTFSEFKAHMQAVRDSLDEAYDDGADPGRLHQLFEVWELEAYAAIQLWDGYVGDEGWEDLYRDFRPT